MALGKKQGAIMKFGGGSLKIQENTNLASASITISAVDCGYITDGSLTDKEGNIELVKDETGNTVQAIPGDIEVRIAGLLMQTDKDTLDFLKGAKGKYYTLKYIMGSYVDGTTKTQTLVVPVARLQRNIEVKAGTKRVPFEFVALPTTQTTTVDSISVASGEYYSISEA